MTIREFCKGFMQRHQLTMATFATSLGYKSPNSVYRLMDEKVRASSLTDFEKKLKEAYTLTPEQLRQLKNACYTKRYGDEKSAFYTIIESYLLQHEPSVPDHDTPFMAIHERYYGRANLRITMMNCLDHSALSAIGNLLASGAEVTHYLNGYIGPMALFRAMNTLSMVMYYPRYTCYAEQTEQTEALKMRGLERADVMWCSYTADDGSEHTDLVQLSAEGPLFHQDTGIPVPACSATYVPVKKQWLQASQLADYATFGMKCEQLDRDRSTMKIKADLTYSQLSGDHMKPLLQNGPMSREPGFDQAVETLREIYNRRYDNTMHKNKSTWHVMKLSAMERFMKTGRISDHMWAMRPFTPEERRKVLSDLLQHCRENRYMHLYLQKSEAISDSLEIDLYDGQCLLFQDSSTDYDLAHSHGEYLLIHPAMLHWCRDYFLNVILKTMCWSETQSIAMLERLLKDSE